MAEFRYRMQGTTAIAALVFAVLFASGASGQTKPQQAPAFGTSSPILLGFLA